MQKKSKMIYFFSQKKVDANASMKEWVGGKGAHLAEMSSLGLPVPPGFTISTQVCTDFYKDKKNQSNRRQEKHQMVPRGWLKPLEKPLKEAIQELEKISGKGFGNAQNPLLVSVRSGGRVSMPGMMDTILNLGLNRESVKGLAKLSGQPRFAWDCYRRFIQMYANVVMGMKTTLLEGELEALKNAKGYKLDTSLKVEDFQALVETFEKELLEQKGEILPQDPYEQLIQAISAVFASWNSPRAQLYRKLHHIPHEWGTAVNVQSMVFGNHGEDSATGVAFTRNPSTGEKYLFGEFLMNAQGEDVVAGLRTPHPLSAFSTLSRTEDVEEEGKKGKKLTKTEKGRKREEREKESKGERRERGESLEEKNPSLYKELSFLCEKLETHYRDMQDIEFTVERGKLWLLQTRTGKRSMRAALQIGLDLLDEGKISEEEFLLRLDAHEIPQLLHSRLDDKADKDILGKGLPASPGGVSGQVVFSSEEALRLKKEGIKTILVRRETSPEDIQGMVAAEGVLTTCGGMTSHAAVVARGMGKCCVVGCHQAQVNMQKEELCFTQAHRASKEGNETATNANVNSNVSTSANANASTTVTTAAVTSTMKKTSKARTAKKGRGGNGGGDEDKSRGRDRGRDRNRDKNKADQKGRLHHFRWVLRGGVCRSSKDLTSTYQCSFFARYGTGRQVPQNGFANQCGHA